MTLTVTNTDTAETDTLVAASYIQVDSSLLTTVINYEYDALYRLTDAAYTGAITASFAYDYDPVGNMTAFTETVDAQTTSVTRSFDGANRLEYAVDASGTTTYTFDANGNLIELLPPGATGANPVGGVRYDYDQRNLMTGQETNPDGAGWVLQAEYVYDGAKDRLQQVDYTGATAITTTFTNDIFGLTQVLVADDGTNEVYNLFGLDLISQDSGSEVRTLLVDGLGSVRLEMVGSAVEAITTYSPYGEILSQSGTSGSDYGFTGEQEDSATGLLYLRARYYNPQLKLFQSRDPWEGSGLRPGTLNYYVYVLNNPVNHTDPSGEIVCLRRGPDGECLLPGNPFQFEPIDLRSFGSTTLDWIRNTGLNLGCDLLGCWCEVDNGFLQPTSDVKWLQAQEDNLIGAANPLAIASATIVNYGGRSFFKEALDKVLSKGKRYVLDPLGDAVKRSGTAREYDVIRFGATVLKRNSGFDAHHGVLDVWFRERNIPGYNSLDAPAVMLHPSDHQKANLVVLDWAEARFGTADLNRVDWNLVTKDEVMGLTKAMFEAAGVPQRVQNNYLVVFWHYMNNLPK